MGRPPLPIGTHGTIKFTKTGNGWEAVTKVRDHDGVTRRVKRTGPTKGAADRNLQIALRDRQGKRRSGEVSADHRFREVAKKWLKGIDRLVAAGKRSPNTSDLYRRQLDNHVLPGLGEFRIREVSVGRIDDFLTAVQDNAGTATAKTCRAVISGVLGMAVRYDALELNPTGQASPLEGTKKRAPRSLTKDERTQWLAQLQADEKAVRRDLPDLYLFMLATGVRIGEALGVSWTEVDPHAGQVEVNYNVIRVRGMGLVRKSTKTAAGERVLPLPSWAVAMLRRRLAETDYPDGPVFPDSLGGLRDPSNTRRDLREVRGTEGFEWVTSHVFRKTAATILDEAGLSARVIADQLGHARPSMTQDVYLGRKTVSRITADALEAAVTESGEFGTRKVPRDLDTSTQQAV